MAIIAPKLQFLDLSHYSWPVKWDELKLNPDLIAIGWKATQGTASFDQYYVQARKEIQDRGFLFAAYHFGDHSDPLLQAKHFLDVAQPDDNMKLVLDWEDLRGNQMTAVQAQIFLEEVGGRTGRICTVYTGNTAKDQLGSNVNAALGKHPLWIPRYASMQPQPQASWKDWDIWQYAADGSGPEPKTAKGCYKVGGAPSYPDCNVFSKDVETVRRTWSGRVSVPIADEVGPAPTLLEVTITINAPKGVKVNVVQT